MTILKKKAPNRLVIDLTGPHGNAFYLLGMARKLSEQFGMDFSEISKEMQAGDYENLVAVFDKHFGAYCDLER